MRSRRREGRRPREKRVETDRVLSVKRGPTPAIFSLQGPPSSLRGDLALPASRHPAHRASCASGDVATPRSSVGPPPP